MDGPQVKCDHIPITDEHLRGFAHAHPMEMNHYSITELPPGSEHKYLATWLIRREMHSFTSDDLGDLVIDVTSIKALLARKAFKYGMVRMELHQEWVDHTFERCGCEEPHIQRLTLEDLKRPGIIMDWGYRRTCQIDGNHRLVRSWREGIKTFEMAVVRCIDVLPHIAPKGGEDRLFDSARALMAAMK